LTIYNYTLSLTSALQWMSGQRYTPVALPTWIRPVIRCAGGWVDIRTDLEKMEILAPNGIRSSDRPAHSDLQYRLSYPSPQIEWVLTYRFEDSRAEGVYPIAPCVTCHVTYCIYS
jgi:hypothetical protein